MRRKADTARDERALQKTAVETLRLLRVRGVVDVQLVPNGTMLALATSFFRAPERHRNVLAFPAIPGFPHPETKLPYLGEVYLNRALHRGDLAAQRMLLIHGILHLIGYRHTRKRDSIRMETLETRLWHRITSSASTSARPRLKRRSSKKTARGSSRGSS